MNEIRCFNCSKLLAKKQGSNDTIEIKCPRCGHITTKK